MMDVDEAGEAIPLKIIGGSESASKMSNDEETSSLISGTMGDGNVGSTSTDMFTSDLDEPVTTTILRDLKRVGSKLVVVVDPRRLLKFCPTEDEVKVNNDIIRRELRNWDLWGPLLICTVLGMTQCWSAPDDQKSLVFSSVFFVVWGGGAVLTVNAQLLGTPLSFFQSICLIGYSIFPLALAAILSQASGSLAFRMPVAIVADLWALRASALFLSSIAKTDRKELVIFPVVLFYFVLTWMVLLE